MTIKTDNLVLKIDLVPETSWFNNMRKMMTRAQWDKIRKNIYAQYNYQCGICRSSLGALDCHEMWEYDEANNIQYLKGLIALCKPCHMIKHIGHTSILASKGIVKMERIIDHFIRVNNCDKETFLIHREEAFEIWRQRSKKHWIVELGEYAGMIK